MLLAQCISLLFIGVHQCLLHAFILVIFNYQICFNSIELYVMSPQIFLLCSLCCYS